MPKASVIISFYNNLRFLRLVLAGFARQSEHDFEVIIADDGSREDVVNELKQMLPSYRFPIHHLWHPDNGWQKNIILNQAVITARADYLIFVDGDCIPHRHFVAEHLKNSKENTILTGRRVWLGEEFSSQLVPEKVEKGFLENIPRHIASKTWQWENSLYLGKSPLRHFTNRKEKGVLGCNFSVSMEAMNLLNGFDERYVHPTVGEDTDIEYRLKNAGYRVKTMKFLAIQYHLWHKKLSREMHEHNMTMLQEVRNKKIVRTPFGINKEG